MILVREHENRFKRFPCTAGEKVKLNEWPTKVKPFCSSKKQYRKLFEDHVEKLSSLQQLHYASNRYALLLIFQGIDAAGKDGAIRHVMSGVNPQGCEVYSFKQPSAEELEHDFLWRTTCRLPERGRIGIFNRSYYEEVLVVRVHPEILRNEGLSDCLGHEKTLWKDRYRSITEMEKHLRRNKTLIIKFFLHLSKNDSASASWKGLRTRRKTGNSALPTFTRESTGKSTRRPLRICLERDLHASCTLVRGSRR